MLAFVLVLILPILAFWPGSSGPFLLDDAVNLEPLGNHGGINRLDDALAFIDQGVSSTLGRPVSLATFLLNAQQWPADPAPFKITNILIHSLSGGLLFMLIFQLMRLRHAATGSALAIATLGALLWALHPLQTSTVLYVIQRMTELAALFALLGLLCYVHGRRQLDSRPKAALGWMSAAVVVMGGLAVLSKENGALLPLLILITEFTLLHASPRPKIWHLWSIPFLLIPSAAIIAYLAYYASQGAAYFAQREFTLTERVLTQSRVLMDYLGQILWPSRTPSLFHDDVVISTGFTQPLTTAFASITIILLITAAIVLRKRLPIISFAVLWFFGAHLLESSVLSLELYYEHRNYLPLVGPALAVAFYVNKLMSQKRTIGIAVGAIIITALGIASWQYASKWGNEPELLNTWSEENPDSARSQMSHVIHLMQSGNVQGAYEANLKLVERHPDDLAVRSLDISVGCEANTVNDDQLKAYGAFAAQAEIDANAFGQFQHLFKITKLGRCQAIDPGRMMYLIEQWLANPKTAANPEMVMWLHLMTSEIYEMQRQIRPTIYALDRAFAARPDLDIQLKKIHLLTQAGFFEAAQNTLNMTRQLDAERGGRYAQILEQAQAVILQGVQAKQRAAETQTTPAPATP